MYYNKLRREGLVCVLLDFFYLVPYKKDSPCPPPPKKIK